MPSINAFGYEYSLTIGIPEQLVNLAVPFNNISDVEVVATGADPSSPDKFSRSTKEDYRTEPSRFFEIIDKQLEAEVDNGKDIDSPAKFKIYNLTTDQLALVQENSTVILRAGYSTELDPNNPDRKQLPLIYVGQVISVSTTDDGENRVTEVICAEGRTPLRNIKISLNWPPGTTYQIMVVTLIDLCTEVGIPLGKFTGDVDRTTIIRDVAPNGYQMAGILGEEMLKLMDNIGFRMYMVLGKLYVEPLYVEPTIEVINISSENIKGTINKDEDGSVGLSGDGAERVGITFKTYLNGNISSNKLLRLSNLLNSEFEGDYKILSTKHILNYEGDAWETEISATRIR